MDFKYILTYSTHKAVYDARTDAIYIPDNYSWKCKQYSVALGSTEFQLSGTYQNTDQSEFPINYAALGGLPLQWTNANIYDVVDSTLYMAGTEPTPVVPFDMKSFLAGLSVGRKLRGVADITHTAYVSQGVCLEFTLEASKWNGTVYTLTVSDHGAADELRLGLPANTSAVNAKRLVESALTMPYVRNYTSNDIQYITMEISAVYAPTEDVQIAIWGFPQ